MSSAGGGSCGRQHGTFRLAALLSASHQCCSSMRLEQRPSSAGGLLDVTLNDYVTTKKFFNSRGTWYGECRRRHGGRCNPAHSVGLLMPTYTQRSSCCHTVRERFCW